MKRDTIFQYKSLNKNLVIIVTMLFLFSNINILTNESIVSSEADTDIIWDVQLNFAEPGGKSDYAIFGEVINATDGPPVDIYDEPKPPAPFPPCIYTWFENDLGIPYDLLLRDYRGYNNMDFKQWNLSVNWMSYDGSTDLNISWNPIEFNTTEYDSVILYHVDENIETRDIGLSVRYCQLLAEPEQSLVSLHAQFGHQVVVKGIAQFRMPQRILDRRLQITELAAAIIAFAFEAIRQDLLFLQQLLYGVC